MNTVQVNDYDATRTALFFLSEVLINQTIREASNVIHGNLLASRVNTPNIE